MAAEALRRLTSEMLSKPGATRATAACPGRKQKSAVRGTGRSGSLELLDGDDQPTASDDPPAGGVEFPAAVAGEVDPRNKLNALTAREWIPETVSVWMQRGLGAGHPDAQIERQHPAPFSFTDVSRLIRFFTKPGETVLDPFVGVGSTLKACALEGRSGIGIELDEQFVALARKRLRSEVRDAFSTARDQRLLVGDARDLLRTLAAESVDFVVTSPPYWNILHKEDRKAKQERKRRSLATRYGDDPRDLGNIHDYPEFLDTLYRILGDAARVLRRKRYMALIVSDFRDKSRFIMFHSDLASALSAYGLGCGAQNVDGLMCAGYVGHVAHERPLRAPTLSANALRLPPLHHRLALGATRLLHPPV